MQDHVLKAPASNLKPSTLSCLMIRGEDSDDEFGADSCRIGIIFRLITGRRSVCCLDFVWDWINVQIRTFGSVGKLVFDRLDRH